MSVLLDLENYHKNFKGEKGSIGKSTFNKDIYYFCVNKSPFPTIIFTYAIHAREYITTYLALKQIDDFIEKGKAGRVYFLPCLNPDGVEICEKKKPLYKANGRGVDLNVNFDARWGQGQFNTTSPGDENYIGQYPFSENESKSLRDFTISVMPNATVSYHSKGEEIYWEFFQTGKLKEINYRLATVVSDATGYPIKKVYNSVGGYKDWCIEKLKIPSITIEVGDDNLSHPIKKEHLKGIYQKNKKVVNDITEKIWI